MRTLSLITILILLNLLNLLSLTGCSVIDFGDKNIKPKVNEDNYWKTPCIWDGTTLKKPYLKKTSEKDLSKKDGQNNPT
jgi:hypothetical protein